MEGRTKEKLLFILERLKKTDEQHPVNTNELIAYLGERGITAERKSVARDVAALRDAGYSIILCDEYKRGYYMTDQLFEDYELKIIADAVSGIPNLVVAEERFLAQNLLPMKILLRLLINFVNLQVPPARKLLKTTPSLTKR